MSEGQEPTATQTERIVPTIDDINLLFEIVNRAKNNLASYVTPRDALLSSYEIEFTERGLDVNQDEVCLVLLQKVLASDVPGDDLIEKFKNVLALEGITVEYDDGVETRDLSYYNLHHSQPPSEPPESAASSFVSSSSENKFMPEAADEEKDDDNDVDSFIQNPSPRSRIYIQQAVNHDRWKLKRDSFREFQSHVQHITHMTHVADAHYAASLKTKALWQWRNVVADHQDDVDKADDHYTHNLKRLAFKLYLDRARHQRARAVEEYRLKEKGMYKIAMAARAAPFRRELDDKLTKKCLSKMLELFRSTQTKQFQLEGILHQQQAGKNIRAEQTGLNVLLQKSRQIQAMNAAADQHYATTLMKKALYAWYHKAHERQRQHQLAEDIRTQFLMRKYLFKMRDLAQAKRERRVILGRWVLQKWRVFVKIKKHHAYQENYATMRRKVKMNLARRHLHQWQAQANKLREMQQQADEHRHKKVRKIAHRAVVRMYEMSSRVQAMQTIAIANSDRITMKHTFIALMDKSSQLRQASEVADRFSRLHDERVAVRCLKQLGRKVFELQRRQTDADVFRARHDKQVVRLALDRMRRRAAENRGEGPLELPPATPSQRRAVELSRLSNVSTTPMYTPGLKREAIPFEMWSRMQSGRIEEQESDEAEEGDDVEDSMMMV